MEHLLLFLAGNYTHLSRWSWDNAIKTDMCKQILIILTVNYLFGLLFFFFGLGVPLKFESLFWECGSELHGRKDE